LVMVMVMMHLVMGEGEGAMHLVMVIARMPLVLHGDGAFGDAWW